MQSAMQSTGYTAPMKEHHVDEKLRPIHKALHHLLSDIKNYSGDLANLKLLQGRVNDIDRQRVNNAWGFEVGKPVPEGQAELHRLLHECYRHLRSQLERLEDLEEFEVHPDLIHVQKELEGILKSLQDLKGRSDWQEHLPKIQGRLDKVDSSRRDGKFGDPSRPLPGQAVLHDLMYEAYGLVQHFLDMEGGEGGIAGRQMGGSAE